MTAADRISAFASVLTRSASDKPPGAGLRGIENNQDPIVHDVFPLHDPRYNLSISLLIGFIVILGETS